MQRDEDQPEPQHLGLCADSEECQHPNDGSGESEH